jgi:SAM-dependent methyltransferase
MPAYRLPWQDLFDRIRAEAISRPVTVYDAACGFGDVMNHLTVEPNPTGLDYLGVDLHGALDTIKRPPNVVLRQGDITRPIDGAGPFDFIICRAAIHHTPDPYATYRTLVSQLAPSGTLAITVYAKKAPMREAIDDELRRRIVPMDSETAFEICNQITSLGRDLQTSGGTVTMRSDLPFLGIKAGTYSVQDFIYQYFMKCWHNAAFPEQHCDLVNFDWYHPPFAYRYYLDELIGWAASNGLTVTRTSSIEAQHYLEAAA